MHTLSNANQGMSVLTSLASTIRVLEDSLKKNNTLRQIVLKKKHNKTKLSLSTLIAEANDVKNRHSKILIECAWFQLDKTYSGYKVIADLVSGLFFCALVTSKYISMNQESIKKQ